MKKNNVTTFPIFFRAPANCAQYFTGVSGSFSSYNFGGGQFLANQRYDTCFRREQGKVTAFCSGDMLGFLNQFTSFSRILFDLLHAEPRNNPGHIWVVRSSRFAGSRRTIRGYKTGPEYYLVGQLTSLYNDFFLLLRTGQGASRPTWASPGRPRGPGRPRRSAVRCLVPPTHKAPQEEFWVQIEQNITTTTKTHFDII